MSGSAPPIRPSPSMVRRPRRAGSPALSSMRSAADGDEFDLEVERGIGWDHATGSPGAVSDGGRAGQLGLATRLHALHAFGPAGDHAVERERRRLAALVGAVELLAVQKHAF